MLELQRVGIRRKNTWLIRNLSIHIHQGTLLKVSGTNGVGKSTLLEVVCGVREISEGSIVISDYLRSSLSYMSSDLSLGARLKVDETLKLALSLNNIPSNRFLIKSVMIQLNIYHLRSCLFYKLSSGQQQRVRIAIIALQDKSIWVLDEPLNFLDKDSIHRVENLISSKLQTGCVILSSHIGLNLKNSVRDICLDEYAVV